MTRVLVVDYPVKRLALDMSSCTDLRRALHEAARTLRSLSRETTEVQFGWQGITMVLERDSDLGWLELAASGVLPGSRIGPFSAELIVAV